MVRSFEQILEEGKCKALERPEDDPDFICRAFIGTALDSLQKLNQMYSNNIEHHIAIQEIKCNKCGCASFAVIAKKVSSPDVILTYRLSDWDLTEDYKFYCPNCKDGQ